MARVSRGVDIQDLVVDVPSINDSSPSPIFLLAKKCLTLHQIVCETLRGISQEEASQNGVDCHAALVEMQDARSRFNAWATSIAALQEGRKQSSLDFRLREATEIRQRILSILRSLAESLQEAFLISSGAKMNEKWEAGTLSDSEEDEERVVVIRNSPSRDDYLKAATRYPLDPIWDIGHVSEKFGSAKGNTKWLIRRLGKSITRRRQYLMYRKMHHGKLSRDWDEPPEDPEGDEKRTIANTKATTFMESRSLVDNNGSEMGSFGSQTSYEQTIAGETTEHQLTVPPPPEQAFKAVPFEFGMPFLCPYCFTEQIVKNKQDWKRHVLHDLRPYVCTFEECTLWMFSSRNEWFAHEMKAHRREWICLTCSKSFTTKSKFQDHLTSNHYPGKAGSELEALVLQSEEPLDKIGPSACKLCDKWEADLKNPRHEEGRVFLNGGKNVEPYGTLIQFRRHLGRHMEQLALFALPIIRKGIVEDSDDSDNGSDIDRELRILETIPNPTDLESLSAPNENPDIMAFNNQAALATPYNSKGKGKEIENLPLPPAESQDFHHIRGTLGEAEKLDKSYIFRRHDYIKFFKPGRIFSTIWTDPYGGTDNASENSQFMTRVDYVSYGERIHTKIRRFVVVRQGDRCCTCLPVTTYDGKGYKKRGIKLHEHGLVYSENHPGQIEGITKKALRVILSKNGERLRNPSLINYGRIYTVDTNVKVKEVGELDLESRRLLTAYYKEVNFPPDDDYDSLGSKETPQTRANSLVAIGAGEGQWR